jgi:hypothetical protein
VGSKRLEISLGHASGKCHLRSPNLRRQLLIGLPDGGTRAQKH